MKKLALLTIGLALSLSVLGQQEGRKRNQQGPGDCDQKLRLEEKLSLTEEQTKKLEELRFSHKSTTKGYRNDLDIRQAELKAAMSTDPVSEKKVNGLVSDINELKGNMFTARINHKLEVRALLDDKQKLIFDSMPRQMGGKRKGKR